MTNKQPCPRESVEQQLVIQWAKLSTGAHPELQLLYHIPNEGKRSRAAGGRMVAEGLKSGVPDLCLPVARGEYHGLYIELKRLRGSTTSKTQTEWIEALASSGYKACICKGHEEAIDTIIHYLGL